MLQIVLCSSKQENLCRMINWLYLIATINLSEYQITMTLFPLGAKYSFRIFLIVVPEAGTINLGSQCFPERKHLSSLR